MEELVPLSLGFDTAILTGSIAESSMKMYQRDFKAYLDYAVTPEIAMQPSTLARWRTHLSANTDFSPNTINRMMSAVKRLMDEAETQGYVPRGTSEDFKRVHGVKVEALKSRQKEHSRVRISPDEMRMLTSLPDPLTLVGIRDRAMLHTLASSGLRIHELATLKRSQVVSVDGGHQLKVIGKNDKSYRDAPLSDEAYEDIKEWLARRSIASDYLFTSFQGKSGQMKAEPLTSVSIWRIVKAYADQCGLEHIKPHDFRRFVGTRLAKTNPRAAQKALGHKKIGTTMDNYVLDDLEVGITNNLY
jgi:integrase/recombinase XerD